MKRTATTAKSRSHSHHGKKIDNGSGGGSGGDGAYTHVTRTLGVLECLAHGPQTTAALAELFHMSARTTTRFLAALERAGAPVYIRKRPGASEVQQWALDVDKFISIFKKRNGA